MRTLLDGSKVEEKREVVTIRIATYCPKKWAFVDMETGDIWVHKDRRFSPKRAKQTMITFFVADEKALNCIGRALDNCNVT